jgi:transcriptional regulator with XRE-family HTH domain
MINRLSQIIKSKELSASQFADEISVQRSSVSHVLSGRNKPSLDFVTKVILRYPDINSEWLLSGRGSMLSDDQFEDNISQSVDDQPSIIKDDIEGSLIPEDIIDKKVERLPEKAHKTKAAKGKTSGGSGSIEKIIFFYKDGSFSEYSPNN